MKTVKVPAFLHHSNMIMFPSPCIEMRVIMSIYSIFASIIQLQDHSFFYTLTNSIRSPIRTTEFHWVELLSGHIYCALPSIQANCGRISYYTRAPSFIKELNYFLYIGQVVNIYILIVYYIYNS